MNRRQTTCVLLILCGILWIERHVKIGPSPDNVDKERFLKRILPFYSNIKSDSRLSHLEDAKFNEQTGEPVAYLRTFEEPFFLPVPKPWCLSSSQNKLTVTYKSREIDTSWLSKDLIKTVVACCFADKDPDAQARMKLRHSLRLFRDSFEEGNVTLIMTFGSMLGSLRYHQRMFYDVDYDFSVDDQDMERAISIMAKLSANSATEMRLIDARFSSANPKFGFLCGNDPGWRQRENLCIEKEESYVVCNSWAGILSVLRPCLFYVDLYWMRKDNSGSLSVNSVNTKFALEDVLTSDYRPLDGTLFRSVRNFERYAEAIYDSSIQMCVPKTGKLGANGEWFKITGDSNPDCTDFALPCAYIDKLHPRTYMLTNGGNRIELGLRWLNSGECVAYSVFVKFT
ncbi:unnamed protein product [Dibothriocephalus latus]|uniref:Uncharacterized protein n=1 Tax=Dibothriocephalus latus TaxID=60516 RepID=A0A3P7LR99_DIBLA|nr:unnamed protein product [Dibothriocephalus latus]